jgi:hypothetical protein
VRKKWLLNVLWLTLAFTGCFPGYPGPSYITASSQAVYFEPNLNTIYLADTTVAEVSVYLRANGRLLFTDLNYPMRQTGMDYLFADTLINKCRDSNEVEIQLFCKGRDHKFFDYFVKLAPPDWKAAAKVYGYIRLSHYKPERPY